MSAPKKGKDLSALKARLAKKAAAAAEPEGADTPGAPAQPAVDVPAPGEAAAAVPAPGEVQRPVADIPAPGEVKKPVDIPAPGEVSKPVDIPAPGQVFQPEPAPMPQQQMQAAFTPKGDIADDPMSGGVAFDPDAGLIDDVGGEIKPRGGIGLPIFAGVVGIVVGVGLGWMAHRSTESRSRVDAARKKAATIEERVNTIEETRALIALKVGEAQDALQAKEPDKAVEALSGLEPTYVELGDLFGWQMAAMDPAIVKSIFTLAEANNSLQLDVGILKGWVAANKEILSNRTKGPASFVVIRSPQGGAILAEYAGAICDEIPAEPPEDFNPDSLKKCDAEGGLEAVLGAKGYMVRTEIGGGASLVPAEQAIFLIPDGPMYTYAIGTNPENNAKAYFDIRMGKLDDVLGQMKKLHEEALEGIGNYTKDPPVNGE